VKIDGTFCRKLAFQGFHCLPVMSWGQVRVPQGHSDGFMPHKFLGRAYVYASHHQSAFSVKYVEQFS